MFKNRLHAGELLAKKLKKYKGAKDTIILGIPRGGVVVASVIAKSLKLVLGVIIVRKIGAPDNPELALGAVAEENCVFWDQDIISSYHLNTKDKNQLLKTKAEEVKKRRVMFGRKIPLKDKHIIVVDDGVATGSTVIAASISIRKQKAARIILATPVIASSTLKNIDGYYDEIVAVDTLKSLYAIGEFYEEFQQVEDFEVLSILNTARSG